MSVRETNSQPATQSVAANRPGRLGDRPVVQWQKPLGFVLILLGVACAGTAAYLIGNRRVWFPGTSFSDLSQIQVIALTSLSCIIGLAIVGVGLYLALNEKSEDLPIDVKPFSVENIVHFRVGAFKTHSKVHRLKNGTPAAYELTTLYPCNITFADGRRRQVYLDPNEVGNFIAVLDKDKVAKNTKMNFPRSDQCDTPNEILSKLDTEIAERAKMF